jgi:threonine dehydrogenase-like Zn-dependent dehydrogenase
MGINHLQMQSVPDPAILNADDAVLKVRLTVTCGSDLHVVDGYLPGIRKGDVLGHEYMGEVVEVGPRAQKVGPGDRVVVPSFFGCGGCRYCEHDLWSLCDNTNPKPELQAPLLGYPTAAIPGYGQPFGGLPGSHAQFIRVPHADVNCFRVPDAATDEQALFLSDAVPTGYMGADFCALRGGETVAVWGSGAVGLMPSAARCSWSPSE